MTIIDRAAVLLRDELGAMTLSNGSFLVEEKFSEADFRDIIRVVLAAIQPTADRATEEEDVDWDEVAARKLRALLDKPIPTKRSDISVEFFDPWEMFNESLYGSYSSEFDEMALTVLRNIREGKSGAGHGESLAHEMFREILCTAGLCDYGTSPRTCFPTPEFANLLPELIGKWERYSQCRWGEHHTRAASQDRP